MLSEQATEIIASHREDHVVLCTMTTIMTFGQRFVHPLNIRVAPLMGGASSIGLGIALARPDKKVIVLDGDGSLAMQLGTLLTVARAAPANFYHFVFNNGVLYEGGGRLPIAASARTNFEGLAREAGYAKTMSISTSKQLASEVGGILSSTGPVFVNLDIDIPPTPEWSEDNPHGELPDWWFVQLRDDCRCVQEALSETLR